MESWVRNLLIGMVASAVLAVLATPAPTHAQTDQKQAPNASDDVPDYTPPPRGAPGGRVGGASRGTYKPAFPLPTVEAVAPRDQSGLSASTAPILYYYVSGPVYWPAQFTVSAPGQPTPVVEAYLTSAKAAGVYPIRLSDYGVRLRPGIIYKWAVAAVLDPAVRSRDLVAGATLLVIAPDPALESRARTLSSARRAVLYARAGLWYDAVAAAAAAAPDDSYASLDALMSDVGLAEPGYTRRTAASLATSRLSR